jgi:saccharopine dehydrogenase-like NADP-dependent oxidoreductase
MDAGGVSVSPRAVTERLLSRAWKLADGEEEFTVLRVAVSGRGKDGTHRGYEFNLLDRTSRENGRTSMARTTGFPCTVLAAMLARGLYRDPGVRPLEFLAREPGVSAQFLDALKARGLEFREEWRRTS